jgi:hypothetical protein
VSEFCYYRLARWLGLPAAPVQLISIPEAVRQEAGAWPLGALIWWVNDAVRDNSVWNAYDDPQAMQVVALQYLACARGYETGELHRAGDGTPFSIDNQDALTILRGRPLETDRWATEIVQAWQVSRQNIPASAVGMMRGVWQQVAGINASTFCRDVLYDSPFADRCGPGWPAVQQAARGLCES